MPCEEVKSEKYRVRKSPPFHAGDCRGDKKKGKDGDYISKANSKGTYKWIKLAGGNKTKRRKASKGVKSYLINDNGNRPFKVEVSGNNVKIYSGKRIDNGTDDYDENRNYNKLIKSLYVTKVYPGESPCELALESGFDCGKDSIGNSVLLHLSGNKYVFVGKEIYEFTMDDEFDAYYSAIGLNSISYPVVLGSKYVYLMLDHIYIPRDIFKAKMNATEWADAHSYYGGQKHFITGEKINCFKANDRKKCEKKYGDERRKILKGVDTKIKGVKIIQKADRV